MTALRFYKFSAFLLVFLSLAFTAFGQETAKSRDERWREDIRLFAEQLPKLHKNLFFHLPKADFEREVKSLETKIPQLSDDEITVALMTIVAKIGDSHTTVRHSKPTFSTFPVSIFRFKEGWYVLGADEKYKEIVGARLVKVGKMPVEKVVAKVSEVIAAENEYWLWSSVNASLQTAEILQAKGVIENKESAQFGFIKDGKPLTVEIKSVPPANMNGIKLVRLSEQIKPTLALKNPQQFYWFEHLPEAKTLYIAYNRCADAEDKPFAKFVEEVFAIADKEKAEKLVIDLRRNSGGNSAIMRPLHEALKQRPHLTEKANSLY